MKNILIIAVIFGAVAVIAVAALDKTTTTQTSISSTGNTPGVLGGLLSSVTKALPFL